MKKSIVFLLVLMILWPVGFTGSGPLITNQGTTAKIINASFSIYVDAFPITRGISKLTSSVSTGDYALQILPLRNILVDQYELVELDLNTNLHSANPYDPGDIESMVSFPAPSGKEVRAGAFWYQSFSSENHEPSGEPGWKVRFTPDEVGEWLAVAYEPALGLQSTPIRFIVRPSNNRGYIHINPKNHRYLAFETGDFFFPIGVNMAWWDDYKDPIREYSRWLQEFSANGGNTIRVWMASWSFGIEWIDTGLGNYDKRQYQAWLLDQLFQLADRYGVKIILVLINHGALSQDTNSEWVDNPFNAALGGPLFRPEQFVKDSRAKAYFQQRLNYIINRWGYAANLLAWEWFNEVDLTPISDIALLPWLIEMTAFLDARDVNHHLTTNSFAMRDQSWLWMLPGLDIVQTHEYSSQINESEHDLAGRAAEDFQSLARSVPQKPILMGEFGYSAANGSDDVEKTGIHLHNGLWATTFSGYAGSGMYWWWENYIDTNNLWYQFKGLANFLNGEDLANYRPFSPLQINSPSGNNDQAIGLGLQGEDILLWLRSNNYTVQASLAAREGKTTSTTYELPVVESLCLTLTDIVNGNYMVKWYEPQGAQWLEAQMVTAHNSTLVIPIPDFSKDLAAKIIRYP